jgi:hypothetical protein
MKHSLPTYETAKKINVPADKLFVQVLIRPLGRNSTMVFDEQAKEIPYNRGIISRFWVRFHLSETEDELKRYGDNQKIRRRMYLRILFFLTLHILLNLLINFSLEIVNIFISNSKYFLLDE